MDNENCEVIEISTQDFVDMMAFKHNMFFGTVEELKKCYSSNESYKYSLSKDTFLDFVRLAYLCLETDSMFYLVDDDIIGKIRNIISEYRYFANTEYKQKINELLMYFNEVNHYDLKTKESVCSSYLSIQENLRNSCFDLDELCFAIAYDAYLFDYLNNDKEIEGITSNEIKYVLSSLNYFMKFMPEIFDDENILEKAIITIQRLRNKNSIIHFRINKELDNMKSELSKINIKKS